MPINSKRRSQLVVPFGVGAMVDFKDETWMTAGLNFWPSEILKSRKSEIIEATQIVDKRLQERVTILLSRQESPVKYFLQPTIKGNSSGPRKPENQDMPFVRFPRWHFCARCSSMQKFTLGQRQLPYCNKPTESGKICRGQLSPIRFLVACQSGHISDFPWRSWIWRGEPSCKEPDCDLKFTTNSRPGLDGVVIKCGKCPKHRTMAGSMGNSDLLREVLPNGACPGEKPWLKGEEEPDSCFQNPTTVQRGASNAYFSNTISSILIPPYSKKIRQVIDKPLISSQIIKIFERCKLDEVNGVSRFDEVTLKDSLEIISGLDPYLVDVPISIIVETAKIKYIEDSDEISASSIDEITYRKKEYEAFLGERPSGEDRRDFDILKQPLLNYSSFIKSIFSEIVLVQSLRETRVLTGFSRIIPGTSGSESVFLYKKNDIPDWLPAIEVRGEGIFLKFNEETINKWLGNNSTEFQNRTNFRKRWIEKSIVNETPNFTRSETATSTLIAIHTFSHLLMRHLIYSCGYDSSSLRERLYVSTELENPMVGLLIYTASGDSEGTLGGLVSQGLPENFERNVRGALEYSTCSNDPICIETERQGIQGLNGAACHSCCLLPETSCEHSNTLLDRTYLFGLWRKSADGLSACFKS